MVITLGTILTQWQQAGIFDLLLPFLLVFAVVFGILEATNILGKNKGIHTIIAIVIGLMALRWPYLSLFFAEIFPRLGVALAVIIALLILVGMFIAHDEARYWYWGLGAVGVVAFIIVITKSFESVGFSGLGSTEDYAGWVVGGVLIIGLIIAVATSNRSSGTTTPHKGEVTRHLHQE